MQFLPKAIVTILSTGFFASALPAMASSPTMHWGGTTLNIRASTCMGRATYAMQLAGLSGIKEFRSTFAFMLLNS